MNPATQYDLIAYLRHGPDCVKTVLSLLDQDDLATIKKTLTNRPDFMRLITGDALPPEKLTTYPYTLSGDMLYDWVTRERCEGWEKVISNVLALVPETTWYKIEAKLHFATMYGYGG